MNAILADRLRAAEHRYRELFEYVPDAILVTMPDGRITSANRSAETIFGRPRTQLAGLTVAALVDGRIALGGGPQRLVGLRPDGSHFPVEAQAAPVDLEGEPRLMLQIRDLTERERVQDHLLQAQKMATIGALVGGVSHELNNPLTAVRGYAELIESEHLLPATTRDDAKRIREAGEKAISLVKTFADFARERPAHREAFRIAEIVDGCQALLRFDFMQPLRPRSSSGVRVIVDLPLTLPRVFGDAARIEQILLTLLQNSLDAFRERAAGRPDPAGVVGSISISAEVVGDRLRCRVADDGPGVPDALRDRLFAPFATSKPDGRGLGLLVAAGIAAANGGSLTLEPTEVGTSFVIELAAERSAFVATPVTLTPAPPKTASAGIEPDRPWVLIVDDEDFIRRLAVRSLEGHDWNVALAEDGADALFQARSHAFDLVLMDHVMPRRTGAATYRDLVAGDDSYRGRVILMSGNEYDPGLADLAADNVPVVDKSACVTPSMLDPTLRQRLGAVGRR